jgi:hypothetical protein
MPSHGNTYERGYGGEHQRLKEHWRPYVEAGLVDCWRCDRPIAPESPWDLGHDDHDRSVYRGPEHMACNRSAARSKMSSKRPAEAHPNRRR